jgi:uncharacterized protein YkwD
MKAGILLGENISYGAHDAKDAVIQLAIDDGVPERGHRANMFKENFHEFGVCYGKHKTLSVMTTAIYRGVTEVKFNQKAEKVIQAGEVAE